MPVTLHVKVNKHLTIKQTLQEDYFSWYRYVVMWLESLAHACAGRKDSCSGQKMAFTTGKQMQQKYAFVKHSLFSISYIIIQTNK